MTLLLDRGDVQVHHAEHLELLAAMPRREDGTVCDALIVDAPYSERTHVGHDDGVDQVGADIYQGRASKRTAACDRKPLSYSSWSVEEVNRFVDAWAPHTRGWLASLTDHVLAPAWERALERNGRYVFAPIACTDPGSRVRLVGDGPSNWSVWLVVARLRTREMQRWGTLPGAYVVPPGVRGERQGRTATGSYVVGGKPLWLMEALVRDYSRPGDLVCDPCCGAGTTLLAALRNGRSAVGGDQMLEHAELAANRLTAGVQRPLFVEGAR